jgi:hypothetical protein
VYNSKEHFNSTYQSFEPEFGFKGQSDIDILKWQQKFRPSLTQAIGLDNLKRDLTGHVPTARKHHSEHLGNLIREKWTLLVEPTVPLPFYLLKPLSAGKNTPLILTPHGHNAPDMYAGVTHNADEYAHMKKGERDIAVQAAQEGYIAIAPTTRGFGDTRTEDDAEEGKKNSCRTQLMHGLLAGRTPIGERVWDMGCLIDWAIGNLDIDESRIAMTGNSGGGTITLFSAACDARISVAMPGSYFCTFKGSIGSIHHCDCNYVPGILRLGEMYDIAGLIYPRPFQAITGECDNIFPLPSVKYAFNELRKIYLIGGAEEDCKLYIGNGGHRYYKDGAWPFIARYFK